MAGNEFDITVFYDHVDMDEAISALRAGGASDEAAMSVHDLVRTGAYQMPSNVTEGGYAIFHLVPLLVHNGAVSVEPLEFGACDLVPEEAEHSRMMAKSVASGNSRVEGALPFVPKGLARIARTLFTDLAPELGAASFGEVKDAVSDLPSHMLGGIISGVRFSPVPETLETSTIPFWHRAVPLTYDLAHLVDSMPRLVRNRNRKILENPDSVGGIALVQLFDEAVSIGSTKISENVTLGLPPKQSLQ